MFKTNMELTIMFSVLFARYWYIELWMILFGLYAFPIPHATCFLTLHGACFCFWNLLPWSLALLLVVMVINVYLLAISSGGTLASQRSGEISATGPISCSTPQMLKVLTERRRVLPSYHVVFDPSLAALYLSPS